MRLFGRISVSEYIGTYVGDLPLGSAPDEDVCKVMDERLREVRAFNCGLTVEKCYVIRDKADLLEMRRVGRTMARP